MTDSIHIPSKNELREDLRARIADLEAKIKKYHAALTKVEDFLHDADHEGGYYVCEACNAIGIYGRKPKHAKACIIAELLGKE
jgi:hypothetical protein